MKIESISATNFQKEEKRVRPKRDNVDRMATVQDLYESEDRIKAHNELLIHQQNQALANAMVILVNMHKNCCNKPNEPEQK